MAAASADTAMDVWILDVGQGSCVVIDCPDHERPLMLDCGSTAGSARGGSSARQVSARRDETVNWINGRLAAWGAPTIVISHPDLDHYGLISRAVSSAATDGIWLGGRRNQFSNAFTAWAGEVERAGGTVSELPNRFAGPSDRDLHCGRNGVSDILIANAAAHASKNGDSVVVAVSYEGVTVVAAGDAEGDTEAQALVTRGGLTRLNGSRAIVLGSHHGAPTKGSNSEAWVEAWAPYAAIFSQKPSSYGHPACDIARRYDAHMAAAVGAHRVPCGRTSSLSTEARMFATSSYGHMLVRIRPGRLEILCEVVGEGCSGTLPTPPIS